MTNLQRQKKHSDELKRAQKKATTLEVAAARAELDKKNGDVVILCPRGSPGAIKCISQGPARVSWGARNAPDNPAWVATKPLVAFPDPPGPYSPILFPGFDKDEYTNRPTEVEEAVDVGIEVEDAEARKDVEAEMEAARAAEDLQDNPSSHEVP
ncbi:hypothetical protein Acr_00g0033970 [Actinidia rufa]|uniref:Uncharacterized protein n=1 Tax=Actinidia rufa TaxID=165716 RepID=A0A7J0DGA9_9ERIC|nr:hypothetical protein Acr_00g0033970 [Actinidia rufa]